MAEQSVGSEIGSPKRSIAGALTVDLEDWRCALSPDPRADYRKRPAPDVEYINKATHAMLEELDAYGAKATFFVLGEVAVAAPEAVKEIARRGHEVASHSPVHLPPRLIPRDDYRRLVLRDVEFLEDLVGTRPVGFRVPYMSLRRSDGWLLKLLADAGFLYDSSVAPTWTPYWGIPFANKVPYFPDFEDIARRSGQLRIVEIPLTVWPMWRSLPGLPIAGGFYMRMWPSRLLRYMLRDNVRKGHPLNLYIHPGNLQDRKEMIENPTFRDRLSQYSRLEEGLPRFRDIMREFKFGAVIDSFADKIPGRRVPGDRIA